MELGVEVRGRWFGCRGGFFLSRIGVCMKKSFLGDFYLLLWEDIRIYYIWVKIYNFIIY